MTHRNVDMPLNIISTLPWSSKVAPKQVNPAPDPPIAMSLQKTRSSPSIFAMSAKSGFYIGQPPPAHSALSACPVTNNSHLSGQSVEQLAEEISTYYSSNPQNRTLPTTETNRKPPTEPEVVSPSVLRKSLTMQQISPSDWVKSSTLPHQYYRSKSIQTINIKLSNIFSGLETFGSN